GFVKGQHLADFAAELTPIPDSSEPVWHLHVDGSSDRRGGGVGIVLEGPNGLVIEQAITFRFQTRNNQAEYEAQIAGLILARELAVVGLECRMDSQLVVGYMNGTFLVKDNQLLRYFHKANNLLKDFVNVNIIHVPREQNARVDLLSKLTHSREKTKLSSVIKMTLDKPIVEAFATNVSTHKADWRQSIRELMVKQEQGEKVSSADSKRIARFLCVGDDLYRRGYTTPLLKCVSEDEVNYVLRELHNGICGFHSGKRTPNARVLRVGYYLPTIDRDCEAFVKKCIFCQAHGNDFRVPPEELHGLISPLSFAQWGMDIVGPLLIAKAQNKFLLVAIDYFTKWIEVEPLAVISGQRVQKFIWHLICRFGLPQKIITDNDRQFIEKRLEDFLKSLGIKHVTSSVEHPQSNGQAEAANKAILTELKK
ncbi:protein NYNRIN-like, partial [Vigna umbellata]|uniref:protein NYNRIN-like n=1 Tax=Vigna umbellata TaxID=87088 RepID=UPI001F5FC2C8